jgi:hypothetical protein
VTIELRGAQIRIHHVTTAWAATVRDGGFAVAHKLRPEGAAGSQWSSAHLPDGLTSVICGLHGFDSSGVHELTDSNPYGPRSAAPYLTGEQPQLTEAVYVSLVLLTGQRVDPVEVRRGIEKVDVAGRVVCISSRDGERFFVQMVAPENIDLPFGTARLRGPVRFARATRDGTCVAFHDQQENAGADSVLNGT